MSSSFASLIEQQIFVVESFTLECGRTLHDVPVAYKTWGVLNEARNNVMIICHAFTGSADVEDWWGPLMGRSKVFDPSRYFIFCANVLGSPYGSASPITTNPDTGMPYGPEFPRTTVRDDVRIHKLVLDSLGVTSVLVAIGGSMGGMAVLEWPLSTPANYVRLIIPIATSARHSAWCISWGEAQRQSIYSDPDYADGYYVRGEGGREPRAGLAAARMTALLTYRSRDSFEKRFGRKAQAPPQPTTPSNATGHGMMTPPHSPVSHADEALAAHNDGHRSAKPRARTPAPAISADSALVPSSGTSTPASQVQPLPLFSAQSYLRYQGDKFTARFDANCYIHITRKMDSHDLARGRPLLDNRSSDDPKTAEVAPHLQILTRLPPALVIGIETDGLFTTTEQHELASHIPNSELVIIPSKDGHDGFLLEFELINGYVLTWLRKMAPEIYEGSVDSEDTGLEGGFEVTKTSMFGEAEADVTRVVVRPATKRRWKQ